MSNSRKVGRGHIFLQFAIFRLGLTWPCLMKIDNKTESLRLHGREIVHAINKCPPWGILVQAGVVIDQSVGSLTIGGLITTSSCYHFCSLAWCLNGSFVTIWQNARSSGCLISILLSIIPLPATCDPLLCCPDNCQLNHAHLCRKLQDNYMLQYSTKLFNSVSKQKPQSNYI